VIKNSPFKDKEVGSLEFELQPMHK